MRPIDGLQRKCFTLGRLSLPSQSHAAMTAMGRLSLFDAATEPPPPLSPTLAAKAHCGRNPRPRPITCAQCEIAPLSPSPPSIVGLLRSDAPSSSNPNFATEDDVPPSRPAASFHFADHRVPPSASRRYEHDARMRGTGSKGRRRQQQSRDCYGRSPLWGYILVNVVSAL